MTNIAALLSEKYKAYLSSESQHSLNAEITCKEYLANELLIDQNKICTDLYIVEKGILRMFYYKDGRDITEHFSSVGEIAFCTESLFLKTPSYLCMETIEPSIIHCINYKRFTELCDQNIEINNLYRSIVEVDLIITQRKADSWRFETARERYARFCIDYASIASRVSLAHIASYLLMSPETLSRVRAGVL